MNDCNDVKIGMRVKVTRLSSTPSMTIHDKHLRVRKAGATGTVTGYVPGHQDRQRSGARKDRGRWEGGDFVSKINDGGQSFPCPAVLSDSASSEVAFSGAEGMSLRAWIAGQALKGILAQHINRSPVYGSRHKDDRRDAAA